MVFCTATQLPDKVVAIKMIASIAKISMISPLCIKGSMPTSYENTNIIPSKTNEIITTIARIARIARIAVTGATSEVVFRLDVFY